MAREAVMAYILKEDKVLVVKKKGNDFWEYPQGGTEENETRKEAFYREMKEELGLDKKDFEKVIETELIYTFNWPNEPYTKQNNYVFLAEIKNDAEPKPDNEELSEAKFVEKEEAKKITPWDDLNALTKELFEKVFK